MCASGGIRTLRASRARDAPKGIFFDEGACAAWSVENVWSLWFIYLFLRSLLLSLLPFVFLLLGFFDSGSGFSCFCSCVGSGFCVML
jgi:hypothetical protein